MFHLGIPLHCILFLFLQLLIVAGQGAMYQKDLVFIYGCIPCAVLLLI